MSFLVPFSEKVICTDFGIFHAPLLFMSGLEWFLPRIILTSYEPRVSTERSLLIVRFAAESGATKLLEKIKINLSIVSMQNDRIIRTVDGIKFYSSTDPILRKIQPPRKVHQTQFGPIFVDPEEPNTILLDTDWINRLRKPTEYHSIMRFKVELLNVEEFLLNPYN